jgi:hypothetical protein
MIISTPAADSGPMAFGQSSENSSNGNGDASGGGVSGGRDTRANWPEYHHGKSGSSKRLNTTSSRQVDSSGIVVKRFRRRRQAPCDAIEGHATASSPHDNHLSPWPNGQIELGNVTRPYRSRARASTRATLGGMPHSGLSIVQPTIRPRPSPTGNAPSSQRPLPGSSVIRIALLSAVLDRHDPSHLGCRDCDDLAAMPVLPPPPATQQTTESVTQ